MKIDIIFVHFAVVAAVAIPYIIFVLIAARERRKLKNKFSKEAEQYGLKINEIDKWNSNLIGIDTTSQKILLVQRRKEVFSVHLIGLRNIKSSMLLHEEKTFRINKKNENILQKIDLELSMCNGEKQLINLYDSEQSYSQDYEMKNADKWNRIILNAISIRPVLNAAA